MDTATVIDPSRNDIGKTLKTATRLNATIMGIVLGLTSGIAIFVFTHISFAVTEAETGLYLNLLSVFLPGYSASCGGALIGTVELFVITYIFSLIFSVVHNSVAAARQKSGVPA